MDPTELLEKLETDEVKEQFHLMYMMGKVKQNSKLRCKQERLVMSEILVHVFFVTTILFFYGPVCTLCVLALL